MRCVALLAVPTLVLLMASSAGSLRSSFLPIYADPPVSTTAEELGNIRDQWVQELHAKQLDQIMARYAPDAVFLNGQRITGQAAIRELFKGIMESFTSNLIVHSIAFESSGDLAYDSGDYQETLEPVAGGPARQLQGNYVIVFKRQTNGKWLIVQHVWTFIGTDIPAPK